MPLWSAVSGQRFDTFGEDLWLRGARHMDSEAQAGLIRRLLRLRSGSRVLDAPCGRGRIAFHLARTGCLPTGVDLSARFVHSARACFRRHGLQGAFFVADLRNIDFQAAFHAVVNWFGSFGYFSEEENLDVLRRMARALKPGGRLLIEQINRERVLRKFMRRAKVGDLTVRNRWNPRTQRVEGLWTTGEGRCKRTSRSSIRVYTPGQFTALFQSAGLRVEGAYGHDGRPYTRGSRRLIMVARKV